MKILFLTDLYPIKKEEKNTPKTLYNFVKDWKKLGHEVDVIRPNFLLNSFLRKKTYYKTGQYENVYNANYITPFCGDIKNKLSDIDFKSYDVVIAHMPSGIIASNKIEGENLICGVHVSDLEVLTNPLYAIYFKPQMEKAYKRAKAIACRSFVIKKKFLDLYPEYEAKTFVAPSGIDFIPIKKHVKSMRNRVVKVVTCAQLIKRKNIDKLIKAVRDNEQIKLTVIGEGKELEPLIRLSDKVKFTGYLPKDIVLEEMKNSDIFILPSVRETFGMVYLEAMAMGCITVCTRNDGIDRIIKDDFNGYLTEPTESGIRETLDRIISLEEGQIYNILQNCYNTVTDYSSTTCANNYIDNILKNI